MALRAFLIVAAAVAAPVFAADHIVGDNIGWNIGFNYTLWGEGQDFHVGDSITFMYTSEDHNVIKVNAAEFQSCTYSNTTQKMWTSGFDVVPLAVPGTQWYISGQNEDCPLGMKLALTVSVAQEPAPAPVSGSSAPPPTDSAAGEVSPMQSCLWLLAAMAAYRITMA